MTRITRSGALAALLALSLALAGCGSGGGSGGGSDTKTLHMGIAVANSGLNFATEMVDGAKQAATNAGHINFKAVGPPNTDGPAEQQLFQNLTQTATDGIVLENLDPPIFTRPAAQAIGSGVPVVALDTAPTDGSKITLYVGNDNYQMGAMLAEQAIKRMPKNPSGVVIVGEPNPGTPVLDSRAKGIKDTFAKRTPKVRVMGPYQTYSDPGQNYNAWVSQVNAHPKALAFLGVGDADSYNLAKIKQSRHGKYLVAGTDVDGKTLQYVKKGVDFVTIDPEHYLKGYIATHLLIDSVRTGHKAPAGWFKTPSLVVDKSNIDQIIAREKSPAAEYNWYKQQIGKLLKNVQGHMQPLKDAR